MKTKYKQRGSFEALLAVALVFFVIFAIGSCRDAAEARECRDKLGGVYVDHVCLDKNAVLKEKRSERKK